jgi:beta-aspartyl-peptidase (threonine type)
MVADARRPVILVHGGAGTIGDDVVDAYADGVRVAATLGWEVLEGGGTALDAVEAAVASMEDAGVFDAGCGSVLNRDGRVQLDAMIMDGSSLAAGAVVAVETVRNPISVARAVMEQSPEVYLVGDGADRFAAQRGFTPVPNEALICERERQRFELARAAVAGGDANLDSGGHGTVGAVALDRAGNLAAGTSTGGIRFKPTGRVGDSSVIGSGGYADNALGAVSCTGEGEAIMRLVLGKWAVDRVGEGRAPQEAADAAVDLLGERLRANGGLILLDRTGSWGVAFNAARMAWAIRSHDEQHAVVARR